MSPDARILQLTRSMRCFAFGWAALIPFLGLGFSAAGVYLFVKTRADAAGQWNPAAKYLNWGLALSLIGWGPSLILACLLLTSGIGSDC